MPKDDRRLPRLPPAPLSPELRAALKSQTPFSPEQLASLASPVLELRGLRSPELQATLLPPERWPLSVIELKQRQLVERWQAIEALERERHAVERKIASEREAARTIEAQLARACGASAAQIPTAIADPAPAPRADASPAAPPRRPKEERRIDHARRAAQALWPQGDPGFLLKTMTQDVNRCLAEEARLSGRPPPRPISPDTVSRSLGRRK